MNFYLDSFKENLLEFQDKICEFAFFYLNNALSQEEQMETYWDIEKVFEKNESSESTTYLNIKKFFKKETKLHDFIEFFFDNPSVINNFKSHVFVMPCVNAKEKLRKSPKNNQIIYDEGIDLYYKKDANINGIAINNIDPRFMSIALNGGSREINIKDSLLYRKRLSEGMKLIEEDFDEWGNTLRRFEGYAKESEESNNSRLNDIAIKLFSQAKQRKTMFNCNMKFEDLKYWNHYKTEDWFEVKIAINCCR